METIELKVDDGGVVRTKRFSGRLLLRRKQNEGLRTRTFSVYATARGQYAVHTRDEPDWSRMSAEDDNSPCGRTRKPGKASGGTRNTASCTSSGTSPECAARCLTT